MRPAPAPSSTLPRRSLPVIRAPATGATTSGDGYQGFPAGDARPIHPLQAPHAARLSVHQPSIWNREAPARGRLDGLQKNNPRHSTENMLLAQPTVIGVEMASYAAGGSTRLPSGSSWRRRWKSTGARYAQTADMVKNRHTMSVASGPPWMEATTGCSTRSHSQLQLSLVRLVPSLEKHRQLGEFNDLN